MLFHPERRMWWVFDGREDKAESDRVVFPYDQVVCSMWRGRFPQTSFVLFEEIGEVTEGFYVDINGNIPSEKQLEKFCAELSQQCLSKSNVAV